MPHKINRHIANNRLLLVIPNSVIVLADVPVQQFAHESNGGIWYDWYHPMKQLFLPATRGLSCVASILPVTEFRSDGAPVFLKPYKSNVVPIRTSQDRKSTRLNSSH